ncbi:MAG: autotransporter-associated beta strand repeat-containing protein, partial [Phycisphaerae bacterium]
ATAATLYLRAQTDNSGQADWSYEANTGTCAADIKGNLSLYVGNPSTVAGHQIYPSFAQTLSGNNSYTGTTTLYLPNGTGGYGGYSTWRLNLNSPTALGVGTFIIQSGSFDNTTGSPLTMTANNVQQWNGNFAFYGGSSLNLGTGAVTLGTANPTVTVSANTLTVGGAIGDTGAARGFTKAGGGTLVLAGANTYTGITTLNAGTLVFAKQAALYNSDTTKWLNTNVPVASGAILAVGVGDSASGYFDTTAISTLLDTSHLDNATGGLATGSSFGLDTTNATAGTFTYPNVIVNPNGGTNVMGIAKLGTGTLVLSNTNTYTGPTTLYAGTLSVNATANLGSAASNLVFNGGTLQVTGTTLTNFSGIGHTVSFTAGQTVGLDIDSAGNSFTVDQVLNQTTGGFTKLGAGTAILNQANTYTGGATLSAGILGLANQNALQNSTLIMNGGTLSFSSSVSGHAFTVGGLAANTSGVGYDIALQDDAVTPNAVALTVGGNNASPLYFGVLSGSGSLTKAGTGTLTLSGANTYTGGTIVTAGVLTLAGANTYTGGTTVTGGRLYLANQNALQNSTLIMSGGSLSFSSYAVSGHAFTIGGLTATTSGAGYNIALQDDYPFGALAVALSVGNNNTNTSYAGVLSASGSLTKVGTGTLTLTGANTYTGSTTLKAGTLNLGSAEIAGTSGPLGKSAAANPGSIVFSGGTLQYSATNTNDYSGRFSTAANQAISIDTNGQNVTFATALTSSGGSLTKSGAGTLTLSSGANTYTGGTTVSAGELDAAKLPNNTALTVGASGIFHLATGVTHTLTQLSSLSVSAGAQLNFANNDVLATGAGSALLTVSQSLAVVGAPSGSSPIATTGLLTGKQWNALYPSTNFDGAPVGTNDLVMKYALAGDTTLKGSIDATDFAQIDATYLKIQGGSFTNSGITWIQGDFDHNGQITGNDFALINFNYVQQSGYTPFAAAQIAASTAMFGSEFTSAYDSLSAGTVPEPASLGLLALGALGLLGRRR